MTNTAPTVVKVSGVKLKGVALEGAYPLVQFDDTSAVIRHPLHGNVRLPRKHTNLPSAAPVTLSYDDLLAEIRNRFDVMSCLVDAIVDGRSRSMIVSGAPGVGKTHTVDAKLAVAKALGKIKKVLYIKGVVSPIFLYRTLWENRKKGEIIVIDDSDKIFYDEDGANIIKHATDTGKRRTVSYMKEANSLEANGIPHSFDYEGSIIVSTNLDFEREVAAKSKSGVHLSAILNRARYLDLGLHSQQALLARIEDVCRTTDMLKDEGLNASQIEDVIGWLKDNQSTVRSMSLRTALRVAEDIVTDPVNWRRMSKVTLLKAISR
jgi:hypothetical protein